MIRLRISLAMFRLIFMAQKILRKLGFQEQVLIKGERGDYFVGRDKINLIKYAYRYFGHHNFRGEKIQFFPYECLLVEGLGLMTYKEFFKRKFEGVYHA